MPAPPLDCLVDPYTEQNPTPHPHSLSFHGHSFLWAQGMRATKRNTNKGSFFLQQSFFRTRTFDSPSATTPDSRRCGSEESEGHLCWHPRVQVGQDIGIAVDARKMCDARRIREVVELCRTPCESGSQRVIGGSRRWYRWVWGGFRSRWDDERQHCNTQQYEATIFWVVARGLVVGYDLSPIEYGAWTNLLMFLHKPSETHGCSNAFRFVYFQG